MIPQSTYHLSHIYIPIQAAMGKTKKGNNGPKAEAKKDAPPTPPVAKNPSEAVAVEVDVVEPADPAFEPQPEPEQPEAGPSSPKATPPAVPTESPPPAALDSISLPPARPSLDSARGDEGDQIAQLEAELAVVRNEKELLGGQYRGLLGKLTSMRQSLGNKLREDAVSDFLCHY